jgi:hypothetical protein
MKHPVYGAGDLKRLAHIVLKELKALSIEQMLDVFAMPGYQIINRNNLVPAL